MTNENSSAGVPVATLREGIAKASLLPWEIDDPSVNGYYFQNAQGGILLTETERALIVAAVNALPGLLDEVEQGAALRAERDALREVVSDCVRWVDSKATTSAFLIAGMRAPCTAEESAEGQRVWEAARAVLASSEAKPTPSKNPAVAEDR